MSCKNCNKLIQELIRTYESLLYQAKLQNKIIDQQDIPKRIAELKELILEEKEALDFSKIKVTRAYDLAAESITHPSFPKKTKECDLCDDMGEIYDKHGTGVAPYPCPKGCKPKKKD